jgi:tight adherence protein B
LGLLALYQFWVNLGEQSLYVRAVRGDRNEHEATVTRSRLDRFVVNSRWGDDVQSTIVLLGWSIRPSSFAFVVIGFCLGIGLVIGYLFSWLLLPVGFWVGALLVRNRVRSMREKRKEDFIAQMPDLARVLSNASSAGLSIRTAVAMAAEELEEPARTELRTVTGQINIGVPLERAMADMEQRLPSRELAILVSSLVVSSRSGGALVTALRDIAEALETRKEVRREIRTTYAQTVATAYSVLSFGLVALLLLESLNGGTVDAMLRNPVGQATLIGSAAVYAGGIWIVRKMTRVEM